MKYITNYHSPYALIKFGDVGYKLAWIFTFDGDEIYNGYACNKHWKTICKTGLFSTYKTLRKFKRSDIICTWRFFPTLKLVQNRIIKAKQ